MGSCGVVGAGVASGLSLRHDHGSQYLSHHFQGERRFLASAPDRLSQDRYNQACLVERHGHRTPVAVRRGLAEYRSGRMITADEVSKKPGAVQAG